MTTAAFCADSNPWDSSILCRLLVGHDDLHEGDAAVRWADHCHFPGDDCQPGHLERAGDRPC